MIGKKKLATYAMTGVFIAATVTTVIASNVAPGSESDPLVTKSYVDTKFEELKSLISSSNSGAPLSETSAILSDEDRQKIITEVLAKIETAQAAESHFVPVKVNKGKVLMGREGTEIILRTGRAFVYSKTENGVSDLTAGKDLPNGESVTKNHYMVVPRDDNRGVIPISDCWFMVKGDYEIK